MDFPLAMITGGSCSIACRNFGRPEVGLCIGSLLGCSIAMPAHTCNAGCFSRWAACSGHIGEVDNG